MANKLIVTLATVNGGLDYCILTAKAPIPLYENGTKLKKSGGTKLSVLLQGNRFTPLNVKIEGDNNVLPNLTDEQINDACLSLKLIPVRFTDCKITLYSINNNMIMSATASGCEILSNKKEN